MTLEESKEVIPITLLAFLIAEISACARGFLSVVRLLYPRPIIFP